jgi:hypothetical protein
MPPIIPVTIHFVGLALFSQMVPNDCGLKVILPQVAYSDPSTQIAMPMQMQSVAPRGVAVKPQGGNPIATGTGISGPIGQAHHVEDHVALLVFPAAGYLPTSNWGAPTALPGDSSYLYVKLDGERIRFDAGNPSQGLVTNLKLPQLKGYCPTLTSLNARFQPPYQGAAAVFDLPQGRVGGCNVAGKRIDTEVALDSSGFLTISASTTRVRKELRLRPVAGSLNLIVANVPVSCLTPAGCAYPNPSALNGVSHVHAYYAMGDGSSASCTSVSDWISNNGALVAHNPCAMSTLPRAAGGISLPDGILKTGVPPTTQGDNFECSNSAWP